MYMGEFSQYVGVFLDEIEHHIQMYCCCSSSDSIWVGVEREAYVGTVYENSGSVSICVISNVTLNGSRTAAAILQTQDVSAHG